jgi:hypothetical protein
MRALTDRSRWPWWLAAALVAVLMVMRWQPWVDDAVEPAPPQAPAIAERMPAANLSSSAQAPTQVATPAPALKLVGTAMSGASSFATVRRTTNSQLLLLRVGDRVDGFAVTMIEPDRVVLAGAAQPIVIEADRTMAVPAPPVLSRPVSSPLASKAEPPTWAEGEAPWDAGPNFRH